VLAPRIVGPLRADGTRIVDARGHHVTFHGIDVIGMQGGSGEPAPPGAPAGACHGWRRPPSQAYDDILHWGFDSVRIGISWADVEPSAPVDGHHDWNAAYLDALDQVVRGFTSRGIVVILQMAQSKWSPAFTNQPGGHGKTICAGYGMPAWLYPDAASITPPQAKVRFFADASMQQGFAAAWSEVASRFASNPMVVGFDLMNEPYLPAGEDPATLHLDAFYAALAPAVHRADPHALLFFQDSAWRGNFTFGLTSKPDVPNGVYTMHLYTRDWDPDGMDETRAYLDRARAWDVPLWIGEFDAFTYASTHATNPGWRSDLTAMLSFCRANGVGWSVFAYGQGTVLIPGTAEPKPGLIPALQAGYAPP
jgi:aryl-phospho-beta-D-glucosidase BglC (GH1 family)